MTTADRTGPAPDAPPDVARLSYEQARDELVAVVQRLESGAGTLEESLALWERGEALAARCQEWLDGARRRLEAASAGTQEPADPSARDGAATHETTTSTDDEHDEG
ncbi:exodeoxyribonuclease VII small subunit [Cellulomonas citrea]|uniref:exodeoxyribonuclease VII small subunit n=1 Tax=Cellulomonas citrea TaxID=1909423 RepID=UPI00135A1BCF|nr:exodeoxyribonuclease VII small subunit [Cellulomonas citrea]